MVSSIPQPNYKLGHFYYKEMSTFLKGNINARTNDFSTWSQKYVNIDIFFLSVFKYPIKTTAH